jgi:hypothetical protein
MGALTAYHSFRLRPAQADEAIVGWYGGHPRGIRAHVWPRCRVCGNPMCHMAQLNAGPALNLGPWQRLTIFICHATGGRCEDWEPFKGANKVLLQATADDDLFDGPPTVRVYRRLLLAADPPTDERELILAGRRANREKEAINQLRIDKLGGGPVWLYGDGTPQSPTGRVPMRLVAQITTNIVTFDITPRGLAYVFIDPSDPTVDVGALVWQSGS